MHRTPLEALLRLGGLWALRDEAFRALLRSAVAELPAEAFSPLSRAEVAKRLATFDAEIAALEEELRRRELERAHAEVDATFAATRP